MLCGMTEVAASKRDGWTADDSTFGARLALIRQRMAWGNVKEAATACGVPAESWRRWERDGRSPRDVLEIAALIAERTGCDYGWLLAGDRLTTYAQQRVGHDRQVTRGYADQIDRTRPGGPNGHPKRTSPDPATRRPARIHAALTPA